MTRHYISILIPLAAVCGVIHVALADPPVSRAADEKHWSFISPVRPTLPEVKDDTWLSNEIDAFILARLEAENIAPSKEAPPATLLRRLYLDLIGFPPTLDQQSRFLRDKSSDAYETVVDELLTSPHYGERWARHWLDAARYADSNGYSVDSLRSIWPYRDWVINAFNSDMPFDQFVIEQVAGDLLPGATRDQKVATGFHRNTMINEEGGIDKEEFRMEAVADRVNTIGTVFLGLTISCTRCHDHKYDPLLQSEFYGLFAYLNNDNEETLKLPTVEQRASIDEAREKLGPLEKDLASYLEEAKADLLPTWEEDLTLAQLREFEPDTRQALFMDPEKRSPEQQKIIFDLFKESDTGYKERARAIRRLKAVGRKVASTLVVSKRAKPRTTRFLLQGDYTRPGDDVLPGVLGILHEQSANAGQTRLDLAKWLVDPANPLLARVTVNRFWQRFFGKGLVETENDFGAQGRRPTHPELLDWLAVEFMDQGWSVKSILKSIVMSATYRRDSNLRDELQRVDPENLLLARQNRLRLDAEVIRDSALSVSGLLEPRIGGPSVYPPQPDGVTKLGQKQRDWPVSRRGDQYRRGIYTSFWRATPYYALTVFDAPNAQESCTRRVRSNTPLQALTLLNDVSFVEFGQALATRIRDEEGRDPVDKIRYALRLALCREPQDAEVRVLQNLFEKQLRASEENEDSAWVLVARALLNLDEFITRE